VQQQNQLNLTNMMASPNLYPLKVDWVQNQMLLVQVGEAFYNNAPFLDQRAFPDRQQPQPPSNWVPLQTVAQQALALASNKSMAWIFHVGHCGSTLLSKALALNPGLFSLREPLPLRDLTSFWLDRKDPWAQASEGGLNNRTAMMRALWARTPAAGQQAIVKATSFCAPLAEHFLTRNSDDKAVMLAVSPETYVASLASVPTYMLDLRKTAKSRMMNMREIVTGALPSLHALSDGELAAMSYIADITAMHQAATACEKRATALDFDTFLTDPASTLQELSAFLGAEIDTAKAQAMALDPIFARYSKAGEYEFSVGERRTRLSEAQESHGEEITKGLNWLTAFIKTEPKAEAALNWFGYSC
jgi:hypothetical protein